LARDRHAGIKECGESPLSIAVYRPAEEVVADADAHSLAVEVTARPVELGDLVGVVLLTMVAE
jgi:hypothetical protein